MDKESTNVFEETVTALINDARSLQERFSSLQQKNDFRGAIDCMRLLKDTLSLIKEYDWELKYLEHNLHDHKEIAIWEQNHCGEIRNRKSWTVINTLDNNTNRWYRMFGDYIISGKSCLVDNAELCRGTGKSYALARLCSEYNGLIIYKEGFQPLSIENADKAIGINNTFVPYKRGIHNMRQYRGKILFVDEGSGMLQEELDELKKDHIVIGFR